MLPECVALNLSFCDFQSCANFGCVLATVFSYYNGQGIGLNSFFQPLSEHMNATDVHMHNHSVKASYILVSPS